ncbi:hypothetical protein [Salipiger sp. H15]|uniref:hypothetical protein n=1 Tax=Alloyangia sp. H15 TaxID=3029062 RepID=UPI003364C36A
MLGLSNSGILHILRRMERSGLVRPAERIAHTRIWERTDPEGHIYPPNGFFGLEAAGPATNPRRSNTKPLKGKRLR